MTVVPKGVGDASGEELVPGTGVPGADVGRGVGRTLGRGVAVGGAGVAVGGGLGDGVGDGALTTTGFGASVLGLLSALVTELNVTVQVPTGNVEDPVHVPDSRGSTVDIGTVRVMEPFDAMALTLMAVSVALPRNSTENEKTVAVVPDSGATAA